MFNSILQRPFTLVEHRQNMMTEAKDQNVGNIQQGTNLNVEI